METDQARQCEVPPAADTSKILRFAHSERLLHWAIAGPFLVSYVTAAILVAVYNPDRSRPFRDVFGRAYFTTTCQRPAGYSRCWSWLR